MGKNTQIEISQAALELFARNGYHGTSIKDITDKLGLTKAAFYAHFKSKGHLFLEIIKNFENYWDELARSVNEKQGNAIDKLHHLISFASDYGAKNIESVIIFYHVSNELGYDPQFTPTLARIRRKQETFLSSLFRMGIQQGLLKKDLDPGILAFNYIAFSQGMFQQWYLNRFRMDGARFVKTYRTLLFKGLVA